MNGNKRGDPKERREQLLNVALDLFALKGLGQTKISDIVEEAGVAQGTFYWHFQSKEAIALEIIHKGQERLLEVIKQGYRTEPANDDNMILSSTHLMTNLFTFAAKNRSLMILLLIKGYGADSSIQKAVSQTFSAMEKAFRSNIERAVELGMLADTIELSLRAAMLTSLVTGTISWWLFGPMRDLDYKPIFSEEEIAEKVVAFEFNGLNGDRPSG